ncbi:hypothetical protein DFH07DRAFT_948267 [Mycena maculata]|uniref:Uncharacterized protein n=1 Tax=Mycena maculata TaxID=230809 RepID=A0AAD7KKC8_9AGAR|nr:hypothetical protein DFH07DRAFT_948267 [Mycena maculata]
MLRTNRTPRLHLPPGISSCAVERAIAAASILHNCAHQQTCQVPFATLPSTGESVERPWGGAPRSDDPEAPVHHHVDGEPIERAWAEQDNSSLAPGGMGPGRRLSDGPFDEALANLRRLQRMKAVAVARRDRHATGLTALTKSRADILRLNLQISALLGRLVFCLPCPSNGCVATTIRIFSPVCRAK